MERLTEKVGHVMRLKREVEGRCIDMDMIVKNLADYENLEESGRLIKLPCTVGDMIWVIGTMGINKAEPYKVTCITYRRDERENNGVYVYAVGAEPISFFLDELWGKMVFLTREAAEAKLNKMKEE